MKTAIVGNTEPTKKITLIITYSDTQSYALETMLICTTNNARFPEH